MPATLNNTTTTTKYTDCSLGGDRGYAFGSLTIANNPVSILVRHGNRGVFTETEYPYVTPTTLPLIASGEDQIVGVQIKSAIAASPAQVSGWLVEPNIAGIQPGAAFTSSVAASGAVTPGQSSLQIQHNGVLVGTEPIIDYIDGGTTAFADDAANTRVTITTPKFTTSTFAGGPPAGPSDGDIWIATAVDGFGARQMFQYNAGSASPYKWEFVGGPPLRTAINNNNAVINTLTQVGATGYYYASNMAYTTVRAGDYIVHGWATFDSNGGAASAISLQGFSDTAVQGNVARAAVWVTAVTTFSFVAVEAPVTGVAASKSIGIAASSGVVGTYKVADAVLYVTPVRIA